MDLNCRGPKHTFVGYCYECNKLHQFAETDRGGMAICECCGFTIRGIDGIDASKELTKMNIRERRENWEYHLEKMRKMR